MEIERKFIVDDVKYSEFLNNNKPLDTNDIIQYYLPALDGTLRVRRIQYKDNTFRFIMSIKKFIKDGVNEELEVNIEPNFAYQMLENVVSKKRIHKIRRKFKFGKHIWEIDNFTDGLQLIIAEVEVKSLNDKITIPDFIYQDVNGYKEVTGDYRLSNEYLARNSSALSDQSVINIVSNT